MVTIIFCVRQKKETYTEVYQLEGGLFLMTQNSKHHDLLWRKMQKKNWIRKILLWETLNIKLMIF